MRNSLTQSENDRRHRKEERANQVESLVCNDKEGGGEREKEKRAENTTLSKILSFKPGGSQNNYSFVCFIYSQNICVSNVYLPRSFTPFLSNPLQTLRDVYGRNESDFYM